MKTTIAIFLLYSASYIVMADEAVTRDLQVGTKDLELDSSESDGDDLERRHKKKRKKHPQTNNPCGYGRTFLGDKFFGQPDYTYVNAPVMNYFFGCGGPIVPQYAPVQPIPVYPIQISQHQGHGGPGGHGHGGHGGHSGHGGHGGYGNQGFNQFGYNMPYQQFQQPYQQGYQQGYSGYPQRPFQSAVSAAASGFGSALADYLTKPRKAQRQVNQLLRPIYRLF